MSFTRTLRAVGGGVVAGALLFSAAPVASADEIRDRQWPLSASSFDAEKVWKESTGKGVTVAVIDDGVDGSHPDLKGNVLAGKEVVKGGRGDQEKQEDHGTAMASLIAGHGHGPGQSEGLKGLAPDAKILPVDVPVTEEGMGGIEGLASGIRFAVDGGATVINMSIGLSSLSDEEKQAIAYAVSHDVLILVASGNDGIPDLGELATTPGVLTVGAVDKAGKIWDDSNYGPGLMLTAPGVHITSASARAGELYHQASGTSDATAYTSAAAALLRSKFPDLTAGQIANRLVKTAGVPQGKQGMKLPDPHYGYGFIRPLRALTQEIPAGSKNGPLKTPKTEPTTPGTGGATAPGASGNGGDQASEQKDSGLGTGAIVGIAAGVLVVVAIIVIVVVRQKKNGRNGPPPGGPGGYGGPGGPGFPQQPGPYQQQPGPYQQQPSAPAFPPAPPTQPPGQ